MKTLFVLVVALLAGCGKKEACSDSKVLGGWTSAVTGETITFADTCTFASDLCSSSGTVPAITANSGTAAVTISSVGTTAGCLAKGDHSCTYQINELVTPVGLAFTCDGGPTANYRKN